MVPAATAPSPGSGECQSTPSRGEGVTHVPIPQHVDPGVEHLDDHHDGNGAQDKCGLEFAQTLRAIDACIRRCKVEKEEINHGNK